jgi:hypothetical protein
MVLFAAVTLLCAVVAWAFWTRRQARQALRDAQLPAGELVSIDTQRANLETLKQQNLYSARWALWAAGSDCADTAGHCAGGIEE